MSKNQTIAVVAIWLGVGISGFAIGEAAVAMAFFAFLATAIVVS